MDHDAAAAPGEALGRTILIFADGTGQAGGRTPDQDISNVYKLYRATRSDPDSPVDALRQIAFYDPGLGTQPDGSGTLTYLWRRARNVAARALGLGIDRNIIDGYAALVRLWRPGDRIFLVGFSRGAFTVRCLGGVLALCGLPTTAPGGRGLLRDPTSAARLAAEAVAIYQHGAGEPPGPNNAPGPKALERRARAAVFRTRYGAGSPETGDASNAEPYFIGVFDTVATIANLSSLVFLGALAFAAAGSVLLLWSVWTMPGLNVLAGLMTAGLVVGLVVGVLLVGRARYGDAADTWRAKLAKIPFLKPFKFYNESLSARVPFARHALAIDENRDDFRVVLWDEDDSTKSEENGPRRLRQMWFAGVHSDIGGSYPEAESRLSDVALDWMVEQMKGLPNPPLFAGARLNLHPSPLGMQHDELKASPGWIPGLRLHIERRGALHDSVVERVKADAVPHYDETRAYRPEGLRDHPAVAAYYR